MRHYPPGSHAGIVVLRPTSLDPDSHLELVDRFLTSYSPDDLHECTVIVEPNRIRIRHPEQRHSGDPERA